MDNNNKHIVFVYGSLKSGFGNHVLFQQSPTSSYLGQGTTAQSAYDMFSFGAFPACVKNHTDAAHKISGEVYSVDAHTFQKLDRLEGNGRFYLREQVEVEVDGNIQQAWMYLLLGTPPSSKERVESLRDGTLKWAHRNHSYDIIQSNSRTY